MAKVPNLILTKRMLDGFKLLNPTQIVSIITGWEVWNEGNTPTFPDDMSELVWRLCLPDFESMADKYQATCERNRQNGKKGGARKKSQNDVEQETQITHSLPVGSNGSESDPIGANNNSNSNSNSNSNNNSNSNWPEEDFTFPSFSIEPKPLSHFVNHKPKPSRQRLSTLMDLELSGDEWEDRLQELAGNMFADFNAPDDYLDEYLIKFNELELEDKIKCLDVYRGYLNYQRGKGKPASLKYYIQDHKWNNEWLVKYVK